MFEAEAEGTGDLPRHSWRVRDICDRKRLFIESQGQDRGKEIPTDDEKTFCLMSAAQGVVSSSSIRVPLVKMPSAWGGRGIGQLHCLDQTDLDLKASYR